MTIDYQRLVADSVEKLTQLLQERRKLDDEIVRLQRLVRTAAEHSRGNNGAAPVTTFPDERLGLTKAVWHVFQTYDIELTAVTIRDLLPTLGFETSRYKEPLTSIHVILRRLVSRQIITRKQGAQGSVVYVRTEETSTAGKQEGSS